MAVKSSDQITIVDLTDGYTISLSSDAISMTAGMTELGGNGTTFTIYVKALRGNQPIDPTIGTPVVPSGSGITCQVGSADGNTHLVPVTISFPSTLSADGVVAIPVTVDTEITITKEFSYSISRTGPKGDTGDRGATWYSGNKITGTSTTAKVFSGSGITAAAIGDHYLNTDTQNVYICTLGGPASTAKWKYEQCIKGAVGVTGATGYIHFKYSNDGGTTFTGNTGEDPGAYLGVKADNTLEDDNVPGHYSWTKVLGETGATGASGEDAILISISASNSAVFKNNQGDTTLTAHVYKAGVELSASTNPTLASLGTLKWYKNPTGATGETAVATGQTLTVYANQVTNKAVYEVRLEA